jgi:uncharacterized protein (DUF983 family)
MADPLYNSPSPLLSGLRCRCPRCGEGKLFAGFLKLAPGCDRCGLSYAFADPADGPAFFVMSGVGIVVIGVFTWIEIVYRPPIWVHFATVFPVLIGACLGTLRPVKAWLVASQFIHKAEEGRFESVGRHDFDERRL